MSIDGAGDSILSGATINEQVISTTDEMMTSLASTDAKPTISPTTTPG